MQLDLSAAAASSCRATPGRLIQLGGALPLLHGRWFLVHGPLLTGVKSQPANGPQVARCYLVQRPVYNVPVDVALLSWA
ncbi:hypothetical protein BJY04DRAFT_185703 [Aspergillus karnatakaensis]|uniref:uncharacterized protein n=1 Tax=Aspergillus karnatakaensis TaxID=1810916 RepID=UPI003CCD63F5